MDVSDGRRFAGPDGEEFGGMRLTQVSDGSGTCFFVPCLTGVVRYDNILDETRVNARRRD